MVAITGIFLTLFTSGLYWNAFLYKLLLYEEITAIFAVQPRTQTTCGLDTNWSDSSSQKVVMES